MTLSRSGLLAVSLLASAGSAHAGNLIVNGDFAGTGGVDGFGQLVPADGVNRTPAYAVTINGWQAAPPDGATTALGMDADYNSTPIYQTVSGLVVGHAYTVSFDWEASQWYGNVGTTTENVTAILGGKAITTDIYTLESKGLSRWMSVSDTFVYDGKTDTLPVLSNGNSTILTTAANALTFIAHGTPVGEPPNVVLSNVELVDDGKTAVPAPTSLAFAGGALLLAAVQISRQRAARICMV